MTTAGAEELGCSIVTPAPPGDSHIRTVRIDDQARACDVLAACAVRAKLLPGRVRVGFRYFNDDTDVSPFLLALRAARPGSQVRPGAAAIATAGIPAYE